MVAVKLFLESGTNKLDQEYKNKALIKSIDTEVMDLLLQHGAHINYQDNNENTPLHLAINRYYSGYPETSISWKSKKKAEYLIKNGADINIINSNGLTPLEIAVDKKDFSLVSLLLRYGAKKNKNKAYEQALISRQTEIVKVLKKYRATYNNKNELLEKAVSSSNLDLTKKLIEDGADFQDTNLIHLV